MGEVVRFKKPSLKERHKGKTLCRSGFHSWESLAQRPFDVKRGRLVIAFRCCRCGATKAEAR